MESRPSLTTTVTRPDSTSQNISKQHEDEQEEQEEDLRHHMLAVYVYPVYIYTEMTQTYTSASCITTANRPLYLLLMFYMAEMLLTLSWPHSLTRLTLNNDIFIDYYWKTIFFILKNFGPDGRVVSAANLQMWWPEFDSSESQNLF